MGLGFRKVENHAPYVSMCNETNLELNCFHKLKMENCPENCTIPLEKLPPCIRDMLFANFIKAQMRQERPDLCVECYRPLATADVQHPEPSVRRQKKEKLPATGNVDASTEPSVRRPRGRPRKVRLPTISEESSLG